MHIPILCTMLYQMYNLHVNYKKMFLCNYNSILSHYKSY